ncbi:MAG: acyl-CoA dehydrogenase family protein, partial [Trebonia sp.]
AGLLARLAPSDGWLPQIAEGSAVASVIIPPDVPYALDADAADVVLAVDGRALRHGVPAAMRSSLDPARRLFTVSPSDALADMTSADVSAAYDLGALMCAAQLSGIGDRLLRITVEYAKTRQQFGRPVGEFQAVKHHLANAYVTLEYARPLLYGAALAYGTADFPREVSAVKAATSDATYFASRIALQVHGAIGYTDEYDPSLLIRKARALRGAWGSPSAHKARVLASLTGQGRPHV